jgi:hypothetical protein
MNLAMQAACNNLMGFVIVAANDDPDKARSVIADMIRAYSPADTIELAIVSQIVGFSLASMDSLSRSIADPDMPDTKILRYRASAASLSRSTEQRRAALNALRTAANPVERPAEPTKPSAATAGAADAQKDQAEAKAKALLNRLDQLHKEWDTNPIPRPTAATARATQILQRTPSGYG